jgi:hypothetical protein
MLRILVLLGLSGSLLAIGQDAWEGFFGPEDAAHVQEKGDDGEVTAQEGGFGPPPCCP